MVFRLAFLFSTLAFSASALAFDVMTDNDAQIEATRADKLITILNDRYSDQNELDLVLDGQGAVQGANYLTTGSSSGTVPDKFFDSNSLANGVVLEEHQGVKALMLSGRIDSAAGHGKWTIKFIANGMTGSYKTCDMNLVRSNQGDWMVMNAYTGAKVETAKIITWTMGITTIEGICPK